MWFQLANVWLPATLYSSSAPTSLDEVCGFSSFGGPRDCRLASPSGARRFRELSKRYEQTPRKLESICRAQRASASRQSGSNSRTFGSPNFLQHSRRGQVLEKWCRQRGSIDSISIEPDCFRENSCCSRCLSSSEACTHTFKALRFAFTSKAGLAVAECPCSDRHRGTLDPAGSTDAGTHPGSLRTGQSSPISGRLCA
jgi:hypothetical protein